MSDKIEGQKITFACSGEASLVGPMVRIEFMDRSCLISADDAREVASTILRVAASIEQDTVLAGFLTNSMGLNFDQVAAIMNALRTHRSGGQEE